MISKLRMSLFEMPLFKLTRCRKKLARFKISWLMLRYVLCWLPASNFELNPPVQAKHVKAEARLQEERATLTQFDNELKELDDTIKVKKEGISDAELNVKQLEHEISALEKDKVTQVGFKANLEKQYDWIREECQWVVSYQPRLCIS